MDLRVCVCSLQQSGETRLIREDDNFTVFSDPSTFHSSPVPFCSSGSHLGASASTYLHILLRTSSFLFVLYAQKSAAIFPGYCRLFDIFAPPYFSWVFVRSLRMSALLVAVRCAQQHIWLLILNNLNMPFLWTLP